MPTIIAEDRYTETKQWFHSLFQVQETTLNGKRERPLYGLRKAAMGRFEGLTFPTRRDENWKYTSVAKILQPRYQEPAPVTVNPEAVKPFLYRGLDTNLLVFVNGVLSEELSNMQELPGKAVLTTTEAALENEAYRDLAREQLLHWDEQGNNPFVALNTAFARHGVFIYVPANMVIEQPIHVLHLLAPQAEPLLISPQVLIIAEQGAQLTLLESYHELPGHRGEPYFVNLVNRMVVKPNASVRHYRVQRQGSNGFLVNTTSVDQHRDSTYTSFVADLGGSIVRNNLSTLHKDVNILTNLYGIFLGTGEQHVDNQTLIDHAHPHCQSNELYKGILADRSRGVFNGKVMVHQDAQKTNAFQQNSTLVLSDQAQMDSKPQLEIFADDVRCSHGATIGQLEEEAVFYLRSRGLTDMQARSMLQHAFIREVIDFVDIDPVREAVEQWVEMKFSEQWGK